MELKTKYSINDTVYLIRKDRKQVVENCPACVGTGSVQLADKIIRTCPECYGRCTKTTYLELEWQVKNTLTIGKVTASITNFEKTGYFDNYGEHKEGANEQDNQYMAYETGIGSGAVYYEHDIYPTMAAAMLECETRNKEQY